MVYSKKCLPKTITIGGKKYIAVKKNAKTKTVYKKKRY